MSNLPELLRTRAEGLRKEAEEQVRDAEVAFYAAQELVKRASEDDRFDDVYKAHMMHMARRQAEAAERNGLFSAVNSRISRLKPEDMAELKAKLSAIEGANKAYKSAYSAAPVSTGLRAAVGAGIGGIVGGLASRDLGSILTGAAVGAGVGGISGVVSKHKFAGKHFDKGEHREVGEAARDRSLSHLTDNHVERKMIELAEHYNPSYPIEDHYDETMGASTFYKKACLETLQGLVRDGQIDPDVAIATAQELDRRLA